MSAIFRFDTQTDENCTNIFESSLSVVPYDIITDLAIIILPIPLLTRIRLPWKQKVILVITFGVGILVIVVDVIRIAQLQSTILSRLQPQYSYNILDIAHQDYTCLWSQPSLILLGICVADNQTDLAAPSFMWFIVDVNMTIICACVPSLRPLANRFTPRLISVSEKETQPHSTPRLSDEESASGGRTRQSGGSEDVGHELLEVLTRGQVQRDVEEEAEYIDEGQAYSSSKPFVNLMNMKPANMLKLNNKESVPPIILITVIYFLWGFSDGILSSINTRFPTHLNLGA